MYYSMKPPERTISNSSFIMLATTSLRLLLKRGQDFSKICGGRTLSEDFWWASKPSADLRLAKKEPYSSPVRPPRFAGVRHSLPSPPPKRRYAPWRRGWRVNWDRRAFMSPYRHRRRHPGRIRGHQLLRLCSLERRERLAFRRCDRRHLFGAPSSAGKRLDSRARPAAI